jgi:hypothetical protein
MDAMKMAGAFDDLHVWIGDEVEVESVEYQRGKAEALNKLLRFTHPDSDEAGAVVLKKNGEVFDFQIGNRNEVVTHIPNGDPVAVLHSHPAGFVHSVRDWSNLLNHPSIEQSHVITDKETYSLHKSSEWQSKGIASERDIEVVLGVALVQIVAEHNEIEVTMLDEEIFERASGLMAKYFGIIYRVGKRS